ncbi:MAG: 30S ribosomal protein S27e [archaeon]|nr:MAG: 30S ribosomal protein S27e [archaeon]
MKSEFLMIRDDECKAEKIMFSNATKIVNCSGCGRTLAENRGGKAVLLANVTVVKHLG